MMSNGILPGTALAGSPAPGGHASLTNSSSRGEAKLELVREVLGMIVPRRIDQMGSRQSP